MAHDGKMVHKRAAFHARSGPAEDVVVSVPVAVPVVTSTPVPAPAVTTPPAVVPPVVTTPPAVVPPVVTTPPAALTTPSAVVPPVVATTSTTTSTTSTITTYATTPPSSQSLASSTPTGIATFAKATSAPPPLTTPKYVAGSAPPSGTIVHGSGTAAGAAATGTAVASGSMSTTTIIGVAAGGLAGVIVIGAIIAFIVRKCRKPKIPEEFNRRSFIRASVQLPNNDSNEKPMRGTAAALALARSNTYTSVATPPLPGAGVKGGPRPPTMLANHYQAPAAQMTSIQPGQYMSNGAGQGYPMAPPASYYAYGQAQAKALPTSPVDQPPQTNAYYRPAQPQYQQHQQQGYQQLAVQQPQQTYSQNQDPANANLARQPTYKSAKSLAAESAVDASFSSSSEEHPGGRQLTSVTPFQAQQYAEISRLVNQPVPAVPSNNEQLERSRSQKAQIARQASPAPAQYARPMDTSDSGFRSPTPPSPLPPPRNIVSPFQRIDSMPPVLPPLASHTSNNSFAMAGQFGSDRSLGSRTGTPVDPNPQQAYYPAPSHAARNVVSAVRTASPEELPEIRTSAAQSYATLNSPHSEPRTPRYHSGVSAVSHVGQAGYAAVPMSASVGGAGGMSLAVPGAHQARPLSVANSDRYSLIDVDDVYGGI